MRIMPKIDYTVRGEILRASRSREGGTPIAKEKRTRTELEIRDKAVSLFTFDSRMLATWEAQPHVSLYEPEAWRWIPDFHPGPYYIFFDDPKDSVFYVEKSWQLLVIFGRVKRKGPYHITNQSADYLITIDQNRIFHGQGTAEVWLRTGIERIYKLIQVTVPQSGSALKVYTSHIEGFGHRLRFVCMYQPSVARGKPLHIILEGCDVIQWTSLTHRPPEVAHLDYVYLSEVHPSRHRVSIAAPAFRMFTHCEAVRIEKDWT